MKKYRRFLAFCLSLVMMLSLFGCSNEQGGNSGDVQSGGETSSGGGDQEVYEITYSCTLAESHMITQLIMQLAEELEERTDGRMTMTVYPNNILGDSRANVEGMQNGSIQMGEMSTAPLSIFTDMLLPMTLPFFFDNFETAYAFCDGEFVDELEDRLAEELGVRPIAWISNGSRALSNSKHPVSTPADMNGLKLRVMESEIYIKTFETLGASPVAMSLGEVFTPLQQGTVDGQDNPTGIFLSSKFNEVQGYFTDLNHSIDMCPVLISEVFYQSLPDDLRQILDDIWTEYTEVERQQIIDNTEAEIETISETVEVTRLTDEQRQAFKEACEPVYEWFEATYPDVGLQGYRDAVAAAAASVKEG